MVNTTMESRMDGLEKIVQEMVQDHGKTETNSMSDSRGWRI